MERKSAQSPLSRFLKIATTLVLALAFALYGAPTRSKRTHFVPQSKHTATAVSAGSNEEIAATVTRVVDGDTIDVETPEGKTVRVRLLGVNTPETVDPRKPVECFGKEASAYTKAHLEGKAITLETDLSQDTYDKYGRLLAYVFLSDGTDFNKQLISDGYAYEYTYHVPYRFQAEFKTAEREARGAERGLWNTAMCPSPDGVLTK